MRRPGMAAGERRRDLEALGSTLAEVLAGLGMVDLEVVLALSREWPGLAGELWAEHSRPVVLRDGELTVEAAGPAALPLLRYATGELQRRLDQRFGEGVVESIRVRPPGR
ncbi:MAG: DUF721 domain-containing protein [Acidimicrobiia bacterium]